jgi:hypothetical protein
VELPKTDRFIGAKSNIQDFEKYDGKRIGLGSFVLDYVVGKGGFGKVWKVYEKSSNKIYAMK